VWLKGDEPERDIRVSLEGIAEVYTTHGTVLRALADAATTDERVESAYRTLVEAFVDANTDRIRVDQRTRRIPASVDAVETARALTWMCERYLLESFGREPAADPRVVVDVLAPIFLATLYGQAPTATERRRTR
jgi:hypothetical protein